MLAPAQQIVSDEIKDKIQPGLRKSNWKPRRRSAEMANAINTLLSLRDAVRIKAPWSPAPQSSASTPNTSGALNLGLLSNSASLLHEMETSPLSFEQSTPLNGAKNYTSRERQRSPDSLSPVNEGGSKNGNYSNSSSAGGSNNHFNGLGSGDNERLTPSEIIDELSYIYPQEDFSLLRIACLKNEITLTKLSARFGFPSYPNSSSPPPSSSNQASNGNGSMSEDFVTQQTFQLLKQQNDYMQMLQQSGVFPGDANGLNLSNLAEAGSSKYPTWFHPLAQAAAAAAAGISLPSTSNSRMSNGNGTNGRTKKKNSADASDSHVFISPKYPVSASKPKTVAAALAASRHSPSGMPSSSSGMTNGKGKKNGTNNRRRQPKGKAASAAAYYQNEDGSLDPSSMVEVTQSDVSSSADNDYGIDLTPDIRRNGLPEDGKDYVPAEYHNEETVSPTANGQDLLSAASMTLENYLRDVGSTSQPTSNGSAIIKVEGNAEGNENNLSESERKKRMVLDAFSGDPDVAGDARGVARKFGLNIRVVLKWLREGPSKSLPALPSNHANSEELRNGSTDTDQDTLSLVEHGLNNNGNEPDTSETFNNNYKIKSASNRRKNAKPNQICDFQTEEIPDDSDGNPLDMVVPIKKRRVSSSNGP